MKFLVTNELKHKTLISTLMLAVSIVLFCYLASDILLHSYVIGSDMHSIASTLYGNEEAFIEPILLDSLLLQVHIDVFMSLISIMILASIYIRFYSDRAATKWFVHSVFLLNLLAPILLIIAFFTSMSFAYLWVVSFLLGHGLAMFMALAIIKRLWFK